MSKLVYLATVQNTVDDPCDPWYIIGETEDLANRAVEHVLHEMFESVEESIFDSENDYADKYTEFRKMYTVDIFEQPLIGKDSDADIQLPRLSNVD